MKKHYNFYNLTKLKTNFLFLFSCCARLGVAEYKFTYKQNRLFTI